jgi:hypothetical protein
VRVARAVPALLLVVSATGCSIFGGGDDEPASVFSVKPGQCFLAPEEVEAQIADLDEVPCGEPHDHEAYAVVPYETADEGGDEFPGDEALNAFANGACAQSFGAYVGVDYPDSELFFTYLLPSPRSWQENDRDVVCLITNAGTQLQGSVKGTKQ